MKALVTLAAAAALFAAVPGPCQDIKESRQAASASKPEKAQTLLDRALKQAKAQRKHVFVIFDASW